MRKLVVSLLLGSLSLYLGGCSYISGVGKDNQPKPTPLKPFTPSKQAKLIWSAHAGNGAGKTQLSLPLTAQQGVVYVSNDNGVVAAYDADTGKRLWATQTKAKLTSGPGVGNGIVVVGTSVGKIIALEQNTGQVRWHKTLATQILAVPQVVDGKVVVKTIDGHLYAINASDGNILWQYEHQAGQYMLRASSTPQITKDKVVAGFNDGKLLAVKLANGQLIWERTVAVPQGASLVQQLIDVDTNPLIVDKTIYVGTYQGRLLAMGLDGEQLLWERAFSTYNNLAFTNNLLFATDADSQVWAIDRQNNRVVWRQPELAARHITGPVLDSDAIVVGDLEGYLHWLSVEDGHFLARVKASNDGITATPIVVNDKLVAVTKTGKVVAYKLLAKQV